MKNKNTRWGRRDNKKYNAGKMRMSGKGTKLIARIIEEKAKKATFHSGFFIFN